MSIPRRAPDTAAVAALEAIFKDSPLRGSLMLPQFTSWRWLAGTMISDTRAARRRLQGARTSKERAEAYGAWVESRNLALATLGECALDRRTMLRVIALLDAERAGERPELEREALIAWAKSSARKWRVR